MSMDGVQAWGEDATAPAGPAGHLTDPPAADPGLSLDDIRDRLTRLPNGLITDADLERIGVTAEQLAQVVDDDAAREADEYDRRQQQHQQVVNAAVDSMTLDEAQATLGYATELRNHTAGCNLDVGQCATCTGQEHDSAATFWDIDVPAAQQRLARGYAAGVDTEPPTDATGAEADHVDRTGPDPWRPATAEPADTPHRNDDAAGPATGDLVDRIDALCADETTTGKGVPALSGDAQRALAHIQARQVSHPDSPATGLYDMTDDQWRQCLTELRHHGYSIGGTVVSGGDRASNDTGYHLNDQPAAPPTDRADAAADTSAADVDDLDAVRAPQAELRPARDLPGPDPSVRCRGSWQQSMPDRHERFAAAIDRAEDALHRIDTATAVYEQAVADEQRSERIAQWQADDAATTAAHTAADYDRGLDAGRSW